MAAELPSQPDIHNQEDPDRQGDPDPPRDECQVLRAGRRRLRLRGKSRYHRRVTQPQVTARLTATRPRDQAGPPRLSPRRLLQHREVRLVLEDQNAVGRRRHHRTTLEIQTSLKGLHLKNGIDNDFQLIEILTRSPGRRLCLPRFLCTSTTLSGCCTVLSTAR